MRSKQSCPHTSKCMYRKLHAIRILTMTYILLPYLMYCFSEVVARKFGATLALCGNHIPVCALGTSGHWYPGNGDFCRASTDLQAVRRADRLARSGARARRGDSRCCAQASRAVSGCRSWARGRSGNGGGSSSSHGRGGSDSMSNSRQRGCRGECSHYWG